MSIFSKLFPGGAKGEPEASPAGAAPIEAGEEGPTMKRTPSDARSSDVARPEHDSPKALSPQRGAPGRAPAPAAQPQGRPPASPFAKPQATVATAQSPHGAQAQGAPARAAPPPAPLAGAPAQAARSPRPDAPTAAGSISPGSYVAVSASRLHGAAAPAAKPVEVASGPGHRSRPEMPAINVGASPAPPQAPPVAVAAAEARPQPPAPAPRKSSRPPAADADRPNGASIADTFERLLSSELDAGFASMQQAPPAAVRVAATTDLGEVRSLFAQLAANHVRSVRDFVIDLRWSDATVEWVPICTPALQSLRRAAEKLELAELCGALDRFSDALSATQGDPRNVIAGERRAAILERYDELSRLMPQAFGLDLDRTQRETVILQSLLLQVPEVKKVTLDKLYSAGLSTLEAMFLATAADIAATTGVPEATAQRIVVRFRAYREQVKATAPDAARTRERQRVADLVSQLRRQHEGYERASQAWSRDAAEQKKELRRVRAQTLLDIQVELARLGEVERLAEIERLPFEAKLSQLESFLEDARDKYSAQP